MSFNKSVRGSRTLCLVPLSISKSTRGLDIREPRLADHFRPRLEHLLTSMSPYVQPNLLHIAKMEYIELMEIEQKLKEKSPKKFQECVIVLPIPTDFKDPKWGPRTYEVIQSSQSTPTAKYANEALKELNSLQRSARAFEGLESDTKTEKSQNRHKNSKFVKSGGKLSHTETVSKHSDTLSAKRTSKQGSPLRNSKEGSHQKVSKDSLSNSLNKSLDRKYSRQDSGSVVISQQEYDRMQRKINLQAAEIDDLTNRLSRFASKQLTDGNPNITDLSDKNRPIKIGERFGELYDNEWTEAFDALIELKYTEEDCIYILLKIVRYAYNFCKTMADKQLQEIQSSMEMHMLHVSFSTSTQSSRATGRHHSHESRSMEQGLRKRQAKGPTMKYSKDYRKASALLTVPDLIQLFKEQTLRTDIRLHYDELPVKLKQYIDLCVELVWLMTVQDPPMVFTWAAKDDRINSDYYKPYRKRGTTVKMTVWPALFLHAKGPMIAKGFVLPR